ncbi:hypothetical protein R0J92_21465, partial [Tritonibacter sp. SIMBA_163]
MRRAEVAIEDHAWDLEESEGANKRMMRCCPEHVSGVPGYMVDMEGKVHRVWRRGQGQSLDLLDEPEEIAVMRREGRDSP